MKDSEDRLAQTEKSAPYEKISPTAKFVAEIRALTDIPFAKELARASGSKAVYDSFVEGMDDTMKRFIPLVEARYKATNQILARLGIKQVLEIATGLSPRGMAMTEDPSITYVATDLPEMLAEEKKLSEEIMAARAGTSGGPRSNLKFVPADATNKNELLEATKDFDHDKPTAVVNEGLLMYLNRSEKAIVAANVKAVIGKSGGVWITPDVSPRKFMERILQGDAKLRKIVEQISGVTERNLETNTFVDEEDIRAFFTEAGYEIEEYAHTNTIPELSSREASDLKEEDLIKLLGSRKTLILRPIV